MDFNQFLFQVINNNPLQEINDYYDKIIITFEMGKASGNLERICEGVLQSDFIQKTSEILVYLKDTGFQKYIKLVFKIMGALQNYSDCNERICTAIITSQIKDIVIQECMKKYYLDNIDDQDVNDLITCMIGIIHNIVRHPSNENYFKSNDLKKKLLQFVQCDAVLLQMNALLALSYLVVNGDKEILKKGVELIKLFISFIKNAQKSKDRRFHGFSIWEILSGLKMISVNDDMKNIIVEEGGIELAIDILKNPGSNKETEFSFGLLMNLYFDKNIYKDCNKKYNIIEILRPYKNSKHDKIRKLYETFEWTLDNYQNENKFISPEHKETFDIFISYSHKNKAGVTEIYNKLMEKKLKVWIDFNEIHGSTVKAMANGIQSSRIFIMCVSNTYRTSEFCHSEAVYAYNLKKPIIPVVFDNEYYHEGWIEFIIGDKYRTKFNKNVEFSYFFNELMQELNHHLEVSIESDFQKVKISPSQCDFIDSKNRKNFENWTNRDLMVWMEKSNLNHLKDKFKDYNGSMLLSLVNIKKTVPNQFYNDLMENKRLSIDDVTKFDSALNELVSRH